MTHTRRSAGVDTRSCKYRPRLQYNHIKTQTHTPVPAVVLTKADSEDTLNLLHGLDIVFADLRDPNILYVAFKGEGEGCVMLVDFDWPAKDGEGRYPTMLNPNNAWHDEVTPYGVIRKSHDLWQLARLKALCHPGA